MILIVIGQFYKTRVGENYSGDSKSVVWSTQTTENNWDFTSSNFMLTKTSYEHYESVNDSVEDVHNDFTPVKTEIPEIEISVHDRRKFTPSPAELSSRLTLKERPSALVTPSTKPTFGTHEVSDFVNDNENTKVKQIDEDSVSKKQLTILFEESKDIFDILPQEYLPDYKSFCWYDSKDEFQCLASVYLAGMPKCGTTDLFDKLMWHPELTTQSHHPTDGSSIQKEYHYWTRARVGWPKNFLSFPRVMPPKTPFSEFLAGTGAEKVRYNDKMRILDGTPSLLWDLGGWETRYPGLEEAPYSNADLIHAVTPDAKILAILRNPVDRLYSEYLYFWKTSRMRKTESRSPQSFHRDASRELRKFNGCLESKPLKHCCYSSDRSFRLRIALGVYVCYVRDFLEVFGGNLFVTTMNEYHSYPTETLIKIFNHIGVSKPNLEELDKFLVTSKTAKMNSDLKDSVGEMLDETRDLLNEFYGPFNSELAKLLNDSKFLFV